MTTPVHEVENTLPAFGALEVEIAVAAPSTGPTSHEIGMPFLWKEAAAGKREDFEKYLAQIPDVAVSLDDWL